MQRWQRLQSSTIGSPYSSLTWPMLIEKPEEDARDICPLLLAISRALARIHVEHDNPRRAPPVHGVDPQARQIGKSSEVLRPGQPLGLDPAHLAGRGSLTHWCPTTDHATHCGIAAQPIGIVHVFVARQPS